MRTIELTTALVTERPMPRGPPRVIKPWWQETTPITKEKTKLLNTPFTTSFTYTTSLSVDKKAAKEILMRWFATQTKAPPNQPTKIANTTSKGSATAMASTRGSTR